MRSRQRYTIFKHICFLLSAILMTGSIIFWMEIASEEPRYVTDAMLGGAILFMLLAGLAWLGFMECRTKLRKYYE